MNTTDAPTVAPEVQEFLTAVRAQLADLDPEEQREILDGLEADLTDLVAERGRGALGDPVDYARELRTAAGLEPQVAGAAARRPLGERINGMLDTVRQRWLAATATVPGRPWEIAVALRPVWWVFRAWLAVQLLDVAVHAHQAHISGQLVPHLRGFGAPVLVLAVLLSVQLGRGHLWPASRRAATARLLIAGLNVCAVVLTPMLVGRAHPASSDASTYGRAYQNGYADAQAQYASPKKGLYADGKWVSQIYPYDAQGHPLVGVQLFNQIGKPLDVVSQPECVYGPDGQPTETSRVYYPWSNGATQVTNVYPVPSRVQASRERDPAAFAQDLKPTVGQFPFLSVPTVSLPGIEPSKARPEPASFDPGVLVQPKDIGC
ncbi:HAAS signaling domain-containing protein [Nocardioides pocheonensis]|uniref:Uncharacterized protein n=1 Tax=Nocardioides pocheonensis TaxID=661485 RepID=A0A3N0GTT9_9ACTN|nr:hypothetical protein [Nocardioides pocheonensis]RNM15883.1 hypothetical protein EFL26_06840 [Nocardioides pocheonensis]